MTGIVHVPDHENIQVYHDEKNEFRKDISLGLSQPNKKIQSKYFYDEHGSELFNKITRHPDYYLTNCEMEILNTYKNVLVELMGSEPFNLVELGPGEGIKTQILIDQFLQKSLRFRYLPIDISVKYLEGLTKKLDQHNNHLKLMPIHADYFRGLEWLSEKSFRRNLILFLGSSIGNLDHDETVGFLHHLCDVLHPGDYALIGFDLRKDVDILMKAYNDSSQITRDFNLNLLKRINRELSADFNLEKFRHYATYNVYTGAMESYLISLSQQLVTMKALDMTIHFHAIEPIHVEYSHKYLLSQVEELANGAGFEVVRHLMDSREYFVDTLWRKK